MCKILGECILKSLNGGQVLKKSVSWITYTGTVDPYFTLEEETGAVRKDRMFT